ncbi:MAG: ADP-ribose pyrophosphatase [Alphaproteobacteria bacterium]|jgi:ADP-ribose pyrophosphatase|nr:ADP-ribose pyrophosphatase [Alphaproteobacteria bacterium]
MRKVEVISRKRVFDDFFKIDEALLRYERYDGTMSPVVRRLCFERGDSAAALLVNVQRRCVHLTEQFKYPALEKAGGWLPDLVAGMIEAGETPEAAIRREIAEEAGFEAATLEPIASVFVSPGGSSERIFLFCARVTDAARKSAGGGVAGEAEDIKVLEWPIDAYLAKVAAGDLPDAKLLIAGYWLKDNLARLMRA